MVVERKRVDRLETKEPAHTKVSPFRPTIEKKGGERVPDTQNKNFAYRLCYSRSVKTDWQCGQQRNNNR